MKILVAIASYGTRQDHYLARIISEYRSMAFHVDIVVLSNISKNVAPGVEVVVGLPEKNPWSLPFGHKKIFADRLNDYDLFIYSEDDMLLTDSHVHAFLKATEALKNDEIAGFIRYEVDQTGNMHYPEVHGNFHWDASSCRVRNGEIFAFFSCEHSACYIVTRDQLRRAIASGGFLAGPHEGKYDLLCTAATDPYTQCGITKLVNISNLNDFAVHHLPDKYIARVGIKQCELLKQIQALIEIGQSGRRASSLFNTETSLRHAEYSKDYYEPIQASVIAQIPLGARNILSIGSGAGFTESHLAKGGYHVTAVPIDPVIASLLDSSDVGLVHGNLKQAFEQLSGRHFDCVILSNVLHLVEDPVELLRAVGALMTADSVAISLVPNIARISRHPKKLANGLKLTKHTSYEQARVQFTSRTAMREWHGNAAMKVEKLIDLFTPARITTARFSPEFVRPFLADELLIVAKQS